MRGLPGEDPCELCGSLAQAILRDLGGGGVHQRCPVCGEFKLTGTGTAVIRKVSRENKVKLSGWVRDQNMLGEVPELSNDRIVAITALPLPGIRERLDRLLKFAVRNQEKISDAFDSHDPALVAITYSLDDEDVKYLLMSLKDEGLIEHVTGQGFQVTPSGHMRYEQFQAFQSASAQGFVAMWFDESLREAYEKGFEVGVRAAGYEPMRVDRFEHIGKIDDEIIAQIRRSRFVVADFTGQRGGVYFEAGFALGLSLPVIWTCRQDEIDKLHIDIRQFNCIDWTDPDELAERLQNRIEATIGAGPRRPLPS